MSAVTPTSPFDPLGLDAPFAEGDTETDRFETEPAWNELDMSPFAQPPMQTDAWSEYFEDGAVNHEVEKLAWLDIETSKAIAESITEASELREEGGYQLVQQEGETRLPTPVNGRERMALELDGFSEYATEVTAEQRNAIDALAVDIIKSNATNDPIYEFRVEGFADVARRIPGPKERKAVEDRVSSQRALNAFNFLVDALNRKGGHAIAERVSKGSRWLGLGTQRLKIPNATTEAQFRRNRRVVFIFRQITFIPPLPEPPKPPSSVIEDRFSVRLLRAATFTVSPVPPIDSFSVGADLQIIDAIDKKLAVFKVIATGAGLSVGPFRGGGGLTITEGPFVKFKTFRLLGRGAPNIDLKSFEGRITVFVDGGGGAGTEVKGGTLSFSFDALEANGANTQPTVIRVPGGKSSVMTPGISAGAVAMGYMRMVGTPSPSEEAFQADQEHIATDQAASASLSTLTAMGEREAEEQYEAFEDRDVKAERFDASPAWNEFEMSPFSEAPASGGVWQEGSEAMLSRFEKEELAWLDVEAADAKTVSMGVDELALDGEDVLEHEHQDHDESLPKDTAGESEYLDDEERDADESYDSYESPQDRFEPETEAANATTATPLTAQQRAWILALDRSAIERLPDAAMRARFLQQDWSDVEFPGNVPRGQSATNTIKQHWALARLLFNAMAEVVTERRVPSSIRFRDRPAVKVPGQPQQRLFGEARDAFVRMHAAAKADDVDLVILSSWRSRARQAAASANQPNPNAVARKASAHMYGLAIDLRMGVPGLPIKEINTRVDRATAAASGTDAKMGNLVRMYRSPVYKWMSLRAREFGWYPYRNEPWHWEYNPPGLKARFEGGTRGELEQEAWGDEAESSWEQANEGGIHAETEYEDAATSPFLRTFTAKALGVKVAVFVTQAARTARQVEMLVFAHGLDLCRPVFKYRPASFITEAPFKLGEFVEACGRPIVLVVPFLDWERLDANGMAFGRKWHRLAHPDIFNQVAAEALEQARAITGSAAPPALQRLILAGHSRAYGFFDALANAYASPQMRAGALGHPTQVWALDTTYSAPIADWRAWLRSRDDLQATVIYRHGKYQNKGSTVVRDLATGVRGKEFMKLASASQGRLTVIPVAAGKVSHCALPMVYLPRLLAALPALTTSGEDKSEVPDEHFEETEDYAGLATEAEALASGDDALAGEWTERSAREEEGSNTPERLDAFGDERDSEWGAESSEEEQWQEDSFEDAEHNLSLALDQENKDPFRADGAGEWEDVIHRSDRAPNGGGAAFPALRPGGLPPSGRGRKKCGTESEMDEIIDELDKMGGTPISTIAEDVIFADYFRREVVPSGGYHPGTAPDGTSVFKDGPPDNVGEMIKFLKKHNPRTDDFVLQRIRNMLNGGINVPDWVMHRPAQETFEFYEVKPASRSGKQKGREKIGKLEAAFGSDPALRHYSAGRHYARRGSSPALIINKGVMHTEVSIEWEPGPVEGLILYTICSESKLRAPQMSPEAAKNIFLAAVLLASMLLGRRGVPVPR